MAIKKNESSGSSYAKEINTSMFTSEQVNDLLRKNSETYESKLREMGQAYIDLQATFDKQNSERDKKITELDVDIKRMEDKVERSTINGFAVIGTFTAVITFISFNANIFKDLVYATDAVLFMIIIAALCMLIIVVPILILTAINNKKVENIWTLWSIVWCCIFLFFLIWLFSYMTNHEIRRTIKDPQNFKTVSWEA